MPDTPSPTPNQKTNWQRWVAGMLAGNALIALLVFGVFYLVQVMVAFDREDAAALVGVPSLLLAPFAAGFLASWIWHPLHPRLRDSIHATFWMSALGILASFLFAGEGIVCLIIVYPLLFLIQLAGVAMGRVWFKNDPTHLRLSVLVLLPLLVVGEFATRQDRTSVVTDSIVINAPPSRVWPQITSFPAIPAKPQYWLFQIGLPYPASTTSAGDFVGASRECIFSGQAVFKETVIGLDPQKELTFSIDELPNDPELIGHLTPTKGQFLLTDNGNGTTTLTGHTWYTLHVRPLWYFDWWTHQIFRAVHLRVMNDVKTRAEAKS